jgi:hypothetical protein
MAVGYAFFLANCCFGNTGLPFDEFGRANRMASACAGDDSSSTGILTEALK